MTEKEYSISNLDCAGCAAKIEAAANKMEGIESAALDFVNKRMIIKYSDDNIDETEKKFFSTAQGIEDGVEFAPVGAKQKKYSRLISTITAVVCLAAALILPLIGASGLAGEVLFVMAILFAGYDCLYSGIKSLLTLRINEKLLMTIAIVAAVILGEYFEAAMVAILFRIGEIIEDRALEKSKNHIESLSVIQADKAVLLHEDGTQEEVDCEKVRIGDIITIAPHTRVPLDGVITSGQTTMDSSVLTGESIPMNAKSGTKVMAGMLNGAGEVEMKVTELLKDSAASRIIQSVRDSVAKKGESEKFITRFAEVYTPIVVLLAVIVAVVPPLLKMGTFPDFVHRALTLLVASCPCALVIGVPLGFFSAVGGMTKLGILVKGGKYIEQLSKLRAVAFDKTGTLTTGELKIDEIFNESDISDDELVNLIASCEYYSTHPIALAIKKSADDIEKFSDYSEEPGMGVKCRDGDKEYICGSHEYLVKNSVKLYDIPGSNVYVACDGKALGGLRLSDSIRPDIKDYLEELDDEGINGMAILSGDNATAVMSVANECGISDAYPALSPEDKVALVEQLKKRYGPTAFVGDGVNDAPVLAAADVGIAMEFGSESAVETSDAVLVSGNIASLPRAMRFSKRTMRTIYAMIAFALIVKVVVLVLAVANLAPMWLAVFADVGVTLISIAIASSLLIPNKEK